MSDSNDLCNCLEVLVGGGLMAAGVLWYIVSRRQSSDSETDLSSSQSPSSEKDSENSSSSSFSSTSLPQGAVASNQGRRPTMEDGHSIVENLCGGKYKLYAVYDGHGGSRAAIYLEEKLPAAVENAARDTSDMEEILRKAISRMEDEFIKIATEDQIEDGATCVVALVGGGKFVVANVGDSECVLFRGGSTLALSVVHTPKRNEEETNRIIAVGGRVVKGRVGHPHLNPQYFNIAVSRAIGDIMYKSGTYTNGKDSGLVATPDVKAVDLSADDEFAVLACDGLWDVVSYQEAYDFVKKTLSDGGDVQEAAGGLVLLAYEKNSMDNITAIVVRLK